MKFDLTLKFNKHAVRKTQIEARDEEHAKRIIVEKRIFGERSPERIKIERSP